jgi:protein O-GlcNAc transferase
MPTLQSSSPPPDLQHAMQLARVYRTGGRPAEAAALYRQWLARFPQQPDLLAEFAELLMQQGDFQDALPLLEEARRVAPGHAQLWLMLTQCLLALDRAKDAKKLITEAIGKGLRHPLADELLKQARSGKKGKPGKPVPLNEALRQMEALLQAGRYPEVETLGRQLQRDHAKVAQVWYLTGLAALLQGHLQDAILPLKRTVEVDPRLAPAQFNLGFALEGLGHLDEALEAYRKAAAAAPQLAEAHNNLGNVLKKLQRHDEALRAYEDTLELRPDIAEYHFNRGDVLRVLERLDEAAAAYEAAIRLKPDFSEAHANLGIVLHLLERNEAAVEALQRAVDIRPDYFEAWQSMGHTLRRLGRHADAADAYRRAAELRPDDAVAHKDLGRELKDLARYEEAIAALRRALALQPDSSEAINLLAGLLLDTGCLDDAYETYRRGLALHPEGAFVLHSNFLLALNYQAGASPESLLAEARAFGEKAARKATPFAHHANVPDPDRRLRVGLVSGDLGQHPVGFFLQNVLESLDPGKLELFAYETATRQDALHQRLRRSIPHWCDARVAALDDEALANRIRSDGIDILIDLAGHTAQNRLPLFAWKPAPVLMTWLGYLGTTGVDAMDYILVDNWALPPAEDGQFTETPWRLPETYICFTPPDLPVEVGPLPALDNGYVTFGCFNNLSKITDEVVACWARLLQAVPDSRLYLKTKSLGQPEVRERLVEKFARLDIDAGRLILEGQFASHEAHFRAYRQVDIALDPFPYPGITTTMEALWMGAPVLSMRGRHFISHQGETILHNLGLPQWIAENEDEYVAKASALARDVPALADVRAGLRERLLASPLSDAPRFARNFEQALRGMWQAWCKERRS